MKPTPYRKVGVGDVTSTVGWVERSVTQHFD